MVKRIHQLSSPLQLEAMLNCWQANDAVLLLDQGLACHQQLLQHSADMLIWVRARQLAALGLELRDAMQVISDDQWLDYYAQAEQILCW